MAAIQFAAGFDLFTSASSDFCRLSPKPSKSQCFSWYFSPMPNSASAEKALRQSLVRRERNRQHRSALRSRLKQFRALLQSGTTQEEADSQFSLVVKALDQAAAKRLIHRNAASRVKSRLAALKKKTFAG